MVMSSGTGWRMMEEVEKERLLAGTLALRARMQ